MASRDVAMGMIFLSQTTIGFGGNLFLLYQYSFVYFTRHTLRPTDLILKHLTVANSLVILSKGVPQVIAAFGLRYFLSDAGCKLVFYVHRVSRGVCMGSTCLLSIFQAITISPMNSAWAQLKLHAPTYILPFNVLCWVLNMLINIILPVNVTGPWNNKTTTKNKDLGYCSVGVNTIELLIHTTSSACYDVLCLGLMTWCSGFMVFILYRHRQQVQHIHRTSLCPNSSPESRVTQSILVLVSTFVSLYTLSSSCLLLLALFPHPSWWLVNTSTLITACFPTVSPFVLMHRDPRITRLGSACCGRSTQFPKLVRSSNRQVLSNLLLSLKRADSHSLFS
ncbi:vomeronasal type-1 receptor 3-like [Nycticebus coucang]|uniref:vomeronasal type-1 receptor 3-like n=1 Tax=Nycticebus coucang TaxID=9470 RepID=UPI00234D8BE5|nr:vomeronasal type-1 receptor 3-like [Nycticebus coucang]